MAQYFGLEFGSSTIKVAQVNLLGVKGFEVMGIGVGPNPAGSLDFSDSIISSKIAGALKKVWEESGIREKRVVVAIPETHVFSRIIEMPMMSDAELSTSLNWEAEQFVPVPLDDVELDYSVVDDGTGSSNKKMYVYVVAALKKKLQAIVDLLLSMGFDPIAVESEMVAIARSLSYVGTNEPTLIINIGALSTLIGIMKNNTLLFSYVLDSGGVAMTRNLAQSLQLPLPQAEEYKRTYGLDPNQMEGKVRSGMLISMERLVNECRKAMEYYLGNRGERVTKILLSGGGAYLPGISSYLTEQFGGGVEISVADPLGAAKVAKGVIIPKDHASLAVVLGLAQRTTI